MNHVDPFGAKSLPAADHAKAVLNTVADEGVELFLSPEGVLGASADDKAKLIPRLPEIWGIMDDIKAVLKEAELSGQYDPLGLEQRKETAYINNSFVYALRMEEDIDKGMDPIEAVKKHAKEDKERQACWDLDDMLKKNNAALKNADDSEKDAYKPNPSSQSAKSDPKRAGIKGMRDAAGLKQAKLHRTRVDPYDTFSAAREWLNWAFTAGGTCLLHYWQGKFWSFEVSKYVMHSDEDMRAQVYRFLNTCANMKGGDLSIKKTLVDNFLDGLRAAAKLSDKIVQPAFLDNVRSPSDYIACKNGLLHLPTRKLEPSSPHYFNGNALDFDYSPKAEPPQNFLTFLNSAWGDDPESVATLQEFFGYFLTLDTSQQKILLLVGPPRSGKGTIGRILTRLIGQTNTCAPTLSALATQFGLQGLIGKQLAIISDARVSPRADIAAIAETLLRISGEDFVSIPRKFQEDHTSRLAIRFMMMSNELPSLTDSSGAIASRFIILRMTHSFYGREDHQLDRRLDSELPAILNWALDGRNRLIARGHFIQPTSSIHLAEQLDSLSSPMKEFLQDCCDIVPGSRIECHVLFMSWQTRCAEQNREQVGTIQTFGKQLIAAAPNVRIVQVRSDGTRTRYYEGILLKRAC